jgi:methylthioribose-1-phosphate isomerase
MTESLETRLGLEGVFPEQTIPLPMRRSGMAEWKGDYVLMLDRRCLPLEESYLQLHTTEQVAAAIEGMAIQGAFSISIAAGYGLALSVPSQNDAVHQELQLAAQRLIETRPTGLAIQRMMQACLSAAEKAGQESQAVQSAILAVVDQAATVLAQQAYATAKNACDLLPDGATILTHCFPDRSYVYLLLETARRGKVINVICSETRPYLQGARLTALCAQQAGFEAKVITDGMGGALMRLGEIDALVTAADRVCMDGTVCNKVGTYQYALAASANGLPYYTLRQSGPDRESAGESQIQIEYRNGEEIVNWAGIRTAPVGVQGYYPSFDITPPELITKIVTDRGVFEPSQIATYFDAEEVVSGAIV